MRSRGAPSRITVALVLTGAAVALRIGGLHRALRLARAVARVAGPEPVSTRSLIHQTALRVAQVAAFFPGRALCLEQSLALFVLLRRRGVDAKLRLGVQAAPFSAHAWVEHDGRPISETQDFVLRLTPFPSIGG